MRVGVEIEQLLGPGRKVHNKFEITLASRQKPRPGATFPMKRIGAALYSLGNRRTLVGGLELRPTTSASKIRRSRDVQSRQQRWGKIDEARGMLDFSVSNTRHSHQ